MGAGRLVTLLSWVLAFSGLTFRVGIRWRSKHHTETGSQVLGAWSPNLDGDLDPLIGVERVGLVCAWDISEECVSRYPVGIYWFVNRYFCETVPIWLWSSTVVRTETW
jgi:hypothetical protein